MAGKTLLERIAKPVAIASLSLLSTFAMGQTDTNYNNTNDSVPQTERSWFDIIDDDYTGTVLDVKEKSMIAMDKSDLNNVKYAPVFYEIIKIKNKHGVEKRLISQYDTDLEPGMELEGISCQEAYKFTYNDIAKWANFPVSDTYKQALQNGDVKLKVDYILTDNPDLN